MIDHGLVFDALVLPKHLPALRELAARYPDLAMVLDHGAKPPIASGDLAAWKQEITALAARDAGRLQTFGPRHRSGHQRRRRTRRLRRSPARKISDRNA